MREACKRVAITQPYIPRYRYKLWDLVVAQLAARDVEARVFFGGDAEALAEQDALGDAVTAPWADQVPTKMWNIGRRLPKLVSRRLPVEWRNALLVTEMQATNLNAWAHLFTNRPYITFGHGKSGTTSNGKLPTALKARLNQNARHVITYEAEGRDAVIAAAGISPEKVSAFGNATDTVSLREVFNSITEAEIKTFYQVHGINSNAQIALFIGALRENKRIDLLCESALDVMHNNADCWLVVAGDGPEREKLEKLSRSTGRVVLLGHAEVAEYGPAAARAKLLVNPGRIGLVAVDALALGLPVLTTPGSERAPEASHLAEGTTLWTAEEDSAASFAAAWSRMDKMRRREPASTSDAPSIERAAARIVDVILRNLHDPS
ncbi:glycosyltransferase [Nesterenkonia sp. CF4.4]|uniref:glycosyltransferase n=1 Tax=Nesterenkonia sp. CF4.4 TaxID=3373079 RepID=UPI003EE57C05